MPGVTGSLRLLTIWPFPDNTVHALAGQVKSMIVPEMNMGQIGREVEFAVKGQCPVVPFGRVDGQPIRPARILELIEEAARG